MAKSKEIDIKTYPLSATKLGTMAKCHKFFDYQYIHRRKVPTNFKYAFGIAVHDMLEKFYTMNFKSEDSFIGYWKMSWYRIREGENQRIGHVPLYNENSRNHVFGYYSGLGSRILRAFYQRDIKRRQILQEQRDEILKKARKKSKPAKVKKAILAEHELFPLVERKFTIDHQGHKIIGFIDRIDRYKDGLAYFDYKTDKYKSSPDDLMVLRNPNHQFTIYNLAMEEMFPHLPVTGRFLIHVRTLAQNLLREQKGQPPLNPNIPVRKIEPDFEKLLEDIEKLKDIIAKGVFEMNIGYHCSWCDHYQHCQEDIGEEYKAAQDPVFPSSEKNLEAHIARIEDEIEQYWEDPILT